MQYVAVFLLALAGYTLIDWGYQRVNHRSVTMASLIFPPSSKVAQAQATSTTTSPVQPTVQYA